MRMFSRQGQFIMNAKVKSFRTLDILLFRERVKTAEEHKLFRNLNKIMKFSRSCMYLFLSEVNCSL